ncbi:MAG: pyruvate:ferredoxin (flavodoxin) oxidoreductase [Christensenellales bacterium]
MVKKITVDGNTAAATIAYQMSEVAAIYPITPSSTMAELCDSWASENKTNIFGNQVKVVEMQSEGGASGTLHGSLCSGALTTTFTASQGLLLMIPNMYKIAGELTPCVMHVSARALATHALSIFGDHSDVMSVRQTGWAMLCSSTVQEAMDLALVAHLSTLQASVPFVHFFDGFRTSHEINTIEDIDFETIKDLVPYDKIREFKSRALNSNAPHQQGTAQNPDIYFQNREASNQFYERTPAIVQDYMNKLGEITGRHYHIFDYYGDTNADKVIVIMGSGASTTEETVKYLNEQFNARLGVIVVRLYRPFASKEFVNTLPKTVTKIAVLDRTKEPGSDGEPLYKDVVCALAENNVTGVKVYGGRYGLGSKEFTPSMVGAVFENLDSENPKNHFTIGINDDITHTSLPINKKIHPNDDSVTACKFYGFGGDGTVSANKSSIKIIGNNTDLNGQAYFEYDSKKSGSATISHLRFGKNKINDSYLLDNIDFVAVHKEAYVTKYNLLKHIKNNGTLLLNTGWTLEELEVVLPNSLKREIAKNNINFYTIDADKIAREIGLGNKINLVMQSAFFKLINIIPIETAVSEMKKYAEKSYGSKGQAILDMNFKAIDSGVNNIIKVNYPASWADLKDTDENTVVGEQEYYDRIIKPITMLEGDKLPVSAFDPRGIVPTNTAKLEKRGVASLLPCWKSENCIQCNMCSFVCPHAAIRPHLIKEENLSDKPDTLQTPNAMAEKDLKFVMQVSSKDCTGCGVCASICPAKEKALVMVDASDLMEQEHNNYQYVNSKPNEKSGVFKPTTLKGSQYNLPYFEFSGACAGCGETAYIKVISQLFGDRMIIANATGCSSIYGGSSPTCPYVKDKNGHGIAWANSLFEDNAEFGYGIRLGHKLQQDTLKKNLNEIYDKEYSDTLNENIEEYLACDNVDRQRELAELIVNELSNIKVDKDMQLVKENIIANKNNFSNQSVWIVGGDGWAYDIGYGGLDHILASGENINILVLDTEVYSNTGGQASKSTPMGAVAKFASNGKRTNKKDLGMIAAQYKDVYVAKVSMGANMNQFLTAIQEAESYNGVSLIIAYAPCINHGIKMENSQLEEKKAVESGYWHLYRYNPLLKEQGKNPFILDSKEPTLDYIDFLNGETRYKSLFAKNEELARELFEEAKQNAKDTYNHYKMLSEKCDF